MNYDEFLKQKQIKINNYGFEISKENMSNILFDFQKDIVFWALKKGKASIFASTGLGKTLMQLEWAKQVFQKEKQNVLIFAPLAVNFQTIKEGNKIGLNIKYIDGKSEITEKGIYITNYERLENFEASDFVAVVLDESSILKGFTSKTKELMLEKFAYTKYKLCCTATPSPNDFVELGNHSEFLNEMKRNEMLSMFFVHDAGDTGTWRLKGHAQSKFWEWIASWACVVNNPSDLGYDGSKFVLPKLNIHQVVVETQDIDHTRLFDTDAKSLTERRNARKNSTSERVEAAKDISEKVDGSLLVWCGLNYESESLKKAIIDSKEIKGSNDKEYKEKTMLEFSELKIKTLITKPSISGFGLNWQHCNNMIFVGISDSFEEYYQAIRRCWRFGQEKEVNVYIIISDKEGNVIENIKRKEKDMQKMNEQIRKFTKKFVIEHIRNNIVSNANYNPQLEMKLPKFILGDDENESY